MSGMVAVIAKVKAKPGRGADFEKMVAGVAATVESAEPGNVFYRAYRTDDPERFVAVEVYEDEAAIEAHRQSAHRADAAARVTEYLDGEVEAEILEEVIR